MPYTLYFLLCYIVFFPTYMLGFTTNQGQILLFISFPIILLIVLFFKKPRFNLIYTTETKLILTVFILILFPIISKLDIINYQLTFAHFRYLAYTIVFVLSFNISYSFKTDFDKIKQLQILIGWSIFIFVILQAVGNENIIIRWITERSIENYRGFRIGGPFDWSYTMAFSLTPILFMLIGCYFTVGLTFSQKILLAVLFILVLLAQSKAAYISILLTFIISLLFFNGYFSLKTKFKILIFTSTVITSTTIYIVNNLDDFGNIKRFIEFIFNSGTDGSTQHRLHQLSYLEYTIKNNILFGFPKLYIVIENAYGYYFYTYGVIGLICYISLMVYFLTSAYKILKNSKNKAYNSIAVAYGMVIYIFTAFIFSLANSPLDGHKASYYFWFLNGVFFGSYHYIRNNKTTSNLTNNIKEE